MLAAGVVYMHKNQAIIGDNEIEKQRYLFSPPYRLFFRCKPLFVILT